MSPLVLTEALRPSMGFCSALLTCDSCLVLHQYFLSLFGLPIGELWDLKELSLYCAKTGRYSFMLTSAPLNHPGLVASPPNALAIF